MTRSEAEVLRKTAIDAERQRAGVRDFLRGWGERMEEKRTRNDSIGRAIAAAARKIEAGRAKP